eukprot:GHVU01191860.1.p9 GENE.GHVU01191860.1~~GHVU01191860.1.p9  ORF type:complete len:103 (+),score=14.58 GHVU01191860.1:757-1065(+)
MQSASHADRDRRTRGDSSGVTTTTAALLQGQGLHNMHCIYSFMHPRLHRGTSVAAAPARIGACSSSSSSSRSTTAQQQHPSSQCFQGDGGSTPGAATPIPVS